MSNWKCDYCGKEFRSGPKLVGGGHYCSIGCAKKVHGEEACKFAPTGVDIVDLIKIIWFPFKAGWWLCKLFFKLLGLIFKIIKPIVKNKWVWTIFSCGLSWVTWKMLNSIYAPKK